MNLTINLEERLIDRARELIGFSNFEDIRSVKIERETSHDELLWSVKLLLFIGDKHIKQIITIDKLAYTTAATIVSYLSELIYGYKCALIDFPDNGASRVSEKPLITLEDTTLKNLALKIQNDINKVTIGFRGKSWTWLKPLNLASFSLIGTEGNYTLVTDEERKHVFDGLNMNIEKFCESIFKITPVIGDRINNILEHAMKREEYSIVLKYTKDNEDEFLQALEEFVEHKKYAHNDIIFENTKIYEDTDDHKMTVILRLSQLVNETHNGRN